ncbi:MAG TPA: hypothetical protein VF549_02500 [Solirubrobacteraceae bacterium]
MIAARRPAQLIWLAAAIVLGGLASASPAQAALCNYQGGAGEDWHHAPSDWSCGKIPDVNDAVVLDGADTVAISSQDEAAATLTTAEGTTIFFSSRTLSVAGAWDTTGGLIRNGGTVHVGGAFAKTGTGQLQLRGSTVLLDAASSISGGSICVGVHQDGNGFMELNHTFSVLAGADPVPFPNCGNTGRIRINGPNGRFLKNSPGTSTMGQGFDNDDTVEIAQGDLVVANGDPGETQTGTWLVPAQHSLRFAGGFNSLTGSVSSAGTVGVDAPGTLSLADGSAFQSSATEIVGGTLNALGSGTATTGQLLLDGGSRSGSRTFTTGSFDARGGSLRDSGATVATGTFTKTTAASLELRGGTLTLNGTSSITGGHICVGVFQDGNGFMEIGGTFSILAGAEATAFPNCGNIGRIRINPGGRFVKDSPGTSVVEQGFDDDGTVEVAQGELAVNQGYGDNLQDGAWLVPAGAVLSFGGGFNGLTGSGSITGAGTLRAAGGSVVLGDGGTYQVTTTEIVGGTLGIDGTTGTAATDSLLLTGGARSGARTFTVGSMDAHGGSLRDAGVTVVTGTFSKTTAGSLDLRGATLTLNGASALDGGNICVGVFQDGDGTLRVGGTLTLAEASASSPILNCGNPSTLTLTPNGRLEMAGTAAKTITSATDNAGGTLAVGAGQTLTLTGAYPQTAGATTVASTGTLHASPSLSGGSLAADGTVDGTVSLVTGAVLRGGGTVTGDVLNSGGVVRPGASPGHLSVGGGYTQSSAGTLDVEIQGTGQGTTYDWLDVTGAATLDGTVNVLRPTGFEPAGTDQFQFLTSASRSGTFATLTGADLPGGAAFTLDYPAGTPFGARLVVDLPPAPTAGQPTITGTPASGQTLTCNTGTWTDVTEFTFQWLRDGTAIGGATQQTYGVVDADRGHALTCRVTGSNAAGSAEATSAAVNVPAPPVVEPPADPPAEQPPVTTPPPAPPPTVPPATPPPADTATPQETQLAAAPPAAVAKALGLPKRACLSRRKFTIRLREPAGVKIKSARVTVAGKRITARRRNGRMTAIVDLRGLKLGRYAVKIVAVTVSGRTLTGVRRYRTCGTKRRAGGVPEL